MSADDRAMVRVVIGAAGLLFSMWVVHATWSFALSEENASRERERMRGLRAVHEALWDFASCNGRLPSTLIELAAAEYGVPMVGPAGDVYLYTRISGTLYRLCSLFPGNERAQPMCSEVPIHVPQLETVDGMPPEDVRSVACRYRA